MSSSEQGQVVSGVELLPHQASFVEACMSPTSPRLVLLRGDAGLGKSRAFAALMSRWQRERPNARILRLRLVDLESGLTACSGNVMMIIGAVMAERGADARQNNGQHQPALPPIQPLRAATLTLSSTPSRSMLNGLH